MFLNLTVFLFGKELTLLMSFVLKNFPDFQEKNNKLSLKVTQVFLMVFYSLLVVKRLHCIPLVNVV